MHQSMADLEKGPGEGGSPVPLVQSLNSLFCARYIGVEPKRVKRESLSLRARVQPLCRARGRESSGTGLPFPLWANIIRP